MMFIFKRLNILQKWEWSMLESSEKLGYKVSHTWEELFSGCSLRNSKSGKDAKKPAIHVTVAAITPKDRVRALIA